VNRAPGLDDLKLIIEALGQLDAEYGRPDAVKLAEQIRAERDARSADVGGR
jgi:hypothetical protein